MKKKLIIFISQPIDNRNKIRLGYKDLKDKFEYQLIDVSLLFNSRIKKFQKKENYDDNNFLLISSIIELVKLTKNISGEFYFLDLTTYRSIFFSIYQNFLIFKKGTKFSVTGLNLPVSIFETKINKLKKILIDKSFFELIKKIIFFFHYKISSFFLPRSKIVFTAGKKDKNKHYKGIKEFTIHALDYDTFINNKGKDFQTQNNYVVYLDQMFFYHPEAEINDIKQDEKLKNLFYAELKIFFQKIIKKFKCHIYILTHPRKNLKYLEFLKNLFSNQNIKIINENNWRYFKSSKFVICHTSSSFQFAILNKKPIIFALSNYFNEYTKNYLFGLANEIGVRPINLKGSIDNSHLTFDQSKYDRYIENYITENKNFNKNFWSIVNDKLYYY